MSDDKGDKKKLSLSGKETLRLKKKALDSSQVRQNLGRGRSKTVVVEHRRKRSAPPAEETVEKPEQTEREERPAEAREERAAPDEAAKEAPPRKLTEGELESRARAVKAAEQAQEERRRAQEEERQRAAERERLAAEKAEEERKRAEERARREAEEEERQRAAEEPQETPEAPAAPAEDSEDARTAKPKPKAKPEKEKPEKPKSEPRRREKKLTIQNALEDADEERQRSLASLRRKREREKRAQQAAASEPRKKVVREVTIPDTITVQELANRMAEKAPEVIKTLMKLGVMATINQAIDGDTAELVVEEFGHSAKRVSESDVEIGVVGDEDRPEDMKPRAPVVTVMGHVDHGKTSLLDALRETDVVSGEAGGITQHIGAYQVTAKGGDKITFIDTPGHAAFSEMRARGANITDIVILVVAADDGIMPQTVEAINHAKAAEVPIVVAINKIDVPGADANKVRQELLQHEVIVESMGGEVLDAEVSAKERKGLDKLEEAIILQAELLELKANPDRRAEGAIIEAKLEKGRGPVATVLIQRGTLAVGDIAVAGSEWGRVRAMVDDRGRQLETAGPAQPVEVLGLSGAPSAGDVFSVVEDEARAREITEFRNRQIKEKTAVAGGAVTLETMFSAMSEDKAEELPIIVKADTQGSAEAVITALENLSTEEVAVRVIHSAVGAITETDVTLARSSNAVIIGFNVRATRQAREQADTEGVELRYYSIIYELVDDLKKALSGMLEPMIKETELGRADVLQVFKVSGFGKAAGCLVTEGVVRRGAKVRLLRDDVVVYEGELASLRRVKDEVKEVQAGTECGMAFANFDDIKEGDVVEVYEVEEVERSL